MKNQLANIYRYKLITVLFSFLIIGCANEQRGETLYLYPKDKSQVITIFSDYNNNLRYIANGKHKTIPKEDYIKLDISEITRLGDEVGVCWKDKNSWEFVNHKARVIEVKLDTIKYSFKQRWYEDDKGIPNAKYFRKENCFTVGILNYSKHFPSENGIVVRE